MKLDKVMVINVDRLLGYYLFAYFEVLTLINKKIRYTMFGTNLKWVLNSTTLKSIICVW